MKIFPALAAVLLTPLAIPLSAQDPLVRDGAHFQVHCHFNLPNAADQALAIAEKTWAATAAIVGVDSKPQKLIELHLYRFRTKFEEAEKEVSQGRNKTTYGFPHYDSMSAHVGIQGWFEDAAITSDGLDYATLGRIADACARLARHEMMPVSRGRLEWLNDGLAQHVAFEVLKGEGLVQDLNADPRFSTLGKVAKGMADGRSMIKTEALVLDDYGNVDGFNRTSVNFLFFHFMQQKKTKKAMTKCLAALAALEEDADDRDVEKILVKTIVPKKLNKPFNQFASKLKPKWDELYPALQTVKTGWMQAGLMESGAQAWMAKPAGPKPWTVTGEFTVLKAGKHQLNLFLGRSGGSYAMLGFSADDGIYLWEYDPGKRAWNKLHETKGNQVEIGKKHSFKVTWNKRRKRNLVIQVDDAEIATVKLTRDMSGQWGVGAVQDAVGYWHSLKIGK